MVEKMNIQQCEICEKFYDINTFEKCPHCGNNNDIKKITNSKKDTGPKKGLLNLFGSDKKEKEVLSSKSVCFNNDSEINGNELKTVYEKEEINNSNEIDSKDDYYLHNIGLTPITPKNDIMQKPSNRGKIERFKNDDNMKTVQVYNTPKEPVVGWLVCIKGACMGEAYTLRSGNNKIGRSRDNDIVIDDSTISREQAVVMFEPRKQNFHLIPNTNASKFMYINDNEVMERTCLEPYTHIEIGEDVELIFVPFCGEKFNWKFC